MRGATIPRESVAFCFPPCDCLSWWRGGIMVCKVRHSPSGAIIKPVDQYNDPGARRTRARQLHCLIDRDGTRVHRARYAFARRRPRGIDVASCEQWHVHHLQDLGARRGKTLLHWQDHSEGLAVSTDGLLLTERSQVSRIADFDRKRCTSVNAHASQQATPCPSPINQIAVSRPQHSHCSCAFGGDQYDCSEIGAMLSAMAYALWEITS